jgi:hypothetical protein
MNDFVNKKFDVSLTGEEILFFEYLMLDKLSTLRNKGDSRKIYDRIFDKFLLIKTKNKFFEKISISGYQKLFDTKTNNSNPNINSSIKESTEDIYSVKTNSNDMFQRREVLSFSDFVKISENNISPIDDNIKTAAKREDGDVNYDRKNIDMLIDMDTSILMSNGQNHEPAPDDIQKPDVKEADDMNKEAEKLNKEGNDIFQEDGEKSVDEFNTKKK